MADLLAYLNFSVVLNKSGTAPVIAFTDQGSYPAGVFAELTSHVYAITQPDGITVSGNSFTVFPELRLASDGNFQKGNYTITYTVTHPSYTDPNVLTKSFSVYYDQPPIILKSAFDVFTPSLKVYDESRYSLPGLSDPVVLRSWYALLAPVGSITGPDLDSFDLLYAGHYYDASYQVSLISILTYPVLGASWATLKDKIIKTANFFTEVPKSLTQLLTEITDYKLANIMDNGCCCDEEPEAKEKYIYALTLFQHFMMRGKCGANRLALRDMINEIYRALHNGIDPVCYNTNAVIQPYSFTNFCGSGCGCGCGDAGSGNSSYTVPVLSIVTAPVGQTVNEFSPAVLSIDVTGGIGPYTYKLSKNGVVIPGAITSTYTIPVSTLPDAGLYTWVVTDAAGGSVTASVNLTVIPNVAPLAIANIDQNISLPLSTATLTGSGTDSDGTIVAYLWTKVSGPAGGVITSPASATTGLTALQAGTYVYNLRVTDDDGATGNDTMTISVSANMAPTSNAGVDQTITLPVSTATLSGVGTDPEGGAMSYLWTKISGPAGGTIDSPTSAVTSISALQPGTYVFNLQVTDNGGAVSNDTITITVYPVVISFLIQPVAQTIASGATANITGTFQDGLAAYTPRLYKNGVLFLTQSPQSGFSLTATVTPANGDTFYWTVTDSLGLVATSATIAITVRPALYIISEPTAVTASVGGPVTLPVLVGGGLPAYTYQWRKKISGVYTIISGATLSTLTIGSAVLGDTGLYQLTTTDSLGATILTSEIALTISAISMAISPQPSSVAVNYGDPFTLTSGAVGGTSPYTYQWQKNISGTWTNIGGATGTSYTVGSAALLNDGTYRFIATDFTGLVSVTSNTATVAVSMALVVTWGYSPTDPYLGGGSAPSIPNPQTGIIVHNADLSLSYPLAAVDKFLVIQVADTESAKNIWWFSGVNNGTVGDGTFRSSYAIGGYRYYVSRDAAGVAFAYTEPLQLRFV